MAGPVEAAAPPPPAPPGRLFPSSFAWRRRRRCCCRRPALPALPGLLSLGLLLSRVCCGESAGNFLGGGGSAPEETSWRGLAEGPRVWVGAREERRAGLRGKFCRGSMREVGVWKGGGVGPPKGRRESFAGRVASLSLPPGAKRGGGGGGVARTALLSPPPVAL